MRAGAEKTRRCNSQPLKEERIRCKIGVQERGNNQRGIKKMPRIARFSTSLSVVSAMPP
mgnify:CR=1 FL=1